MKRSILLSYSLATFLILTFTSTHIFAAEEPKDIEAYFELGNANYSKGQYDEAIADYSKVLELNPKYAEAYFNKALTYEKMGRKEAIEAYKDFVKYASDKYAVFIEQAKKRIKELEEKVK